MEKEELKKECCNINFIANEYYPLLIGYLSNISKNRDIAEEVTQEVMIKLINARNKNISVRNIKAWLFEIARNTLADYYRGSAKKPGLYTNFHDLQINEDFQYTPGDYIVPMITLLPPQYSKPLYLSDIKNIPQVKIAKEMKLSISATKMRIQRARKMLFKKLIQCCDVEYTKNGGFSYCTIKDSCLKLR